MGNLFQELKRRNVYKVATLYVVAGWVLLQVGDVVVPIFGLPENTLRIPALVLIVGFPIILILSWVYDFTTEGIVKTSQATTSTTAPAFSTDLIVIFLLLIIVGFSTFERLSQVDVLSGLAGSPQDAEPLPVRRYSLNLGPAEFHPNRGINTNFVISPDGARLAYFKFDSASWHLYVRELDELEPRAMNVSIPQSGEFPIPVFSADGEHIAYYSRSGLMRVAVNGDPAPQLVTDQSISIGSLGLAWIGDELFFVATENKLYRIPATGGVATPVALRGIENIFSSGFPYAVPGSETILLSVLQGNATTEFIPSVLLHNTVSGQTTTLIQGATAPRYVASGHIIFLRSESLWAVPFDAQALEIVGDEVEIPIAIEGYIGFGLRNYSVSDNGQFIYQPASNINLQQRLAASALGVPVWVDRSGQETALAMPAGNYFDPQLSPGDTRLAIRIENSQGPRIWSFDFSRGAFQRLTFSGAAISPKWTPDGQQLAYADAIAGFSFWLISADGSGEPQRLYGPTGDGNIMGFTPDGNTLLYSARNENTDSTDLYKLSLGDEPVSEVLLESPFIESGARVSPNGRWIAYHSNESGQLEVYVRPYPNIQDSKWQVSTDGGGEANWREDSGELYYSRTREDIKGIWAVSVEGDSELLLGRPELVVSGNYRSVQGESYDVSEEGDRFLMIKPASDLEAEIASELVSLVVVENWFEELKRLAPPNQN